MLVATECPIRCGMFGHTFVVGSVSLLRGVDRVCLHTHSRTPVEDCIRRSSTVGENCDGEWYVATHTHTRLAHTHSPSSRHAGFYTPLGVFTVAGLHVLPLYLYILQHLPPSLAHVSSLFLYTPLVVLATGRVLALAVEVKSCF